MVTEKITVTDVTARSSNGYNFLKGKIYSAPSPDFAVQIVHGMSEHMLRYTEFAEYLCETLNCAVILYDNCGHGQSIFKKEEYGYIAARRGYKYIVEDTNVVLNKARETIGDIPVFLLGYDMGSYIARSSVTEHKENYCGLIVIGTAYKNFMMNILLRKCKDEIAINGESYLSISLYKKFIFGYNKNFEKRTEVDWLSSDNEQVDKYLADPICNFALSASAIKDILKVRENCNDNDWFKKLPKIPVLLLSGKEDPACHRSADTFKIAKKLENNGINTTVKTYESARHDLLHEKCKQQVYDDIKDWISLNR